MVLIAFSHDPLPRHYRGDNEYGSRTKKRVWVGRSQKEQENEEISVVS